MPNDNGIVDLDQHQKDKDEFDATTEAILNAEDGTSDEDIIKSMDSTDADDKTDKAREATKDPDESTEDGVLSEDDAKKFVADPEGVAHLDNSTDAGNDKLVPDDADWKVKFEASDAALKKEQQKTSSWDGRIRAANEKVKVLEAENATLREQLESKTVLDPDKESDQEVLDRFRKDFPELADVVTVLEKRVTNNQPPKAKAPKTVADDAEGNSGKSTIADEAKPDNTHMNDIHTKHPDLNEMVNTGVLLTWINKQKPYIKPTLEDIYYNGASQAVIDLCTQFKDSTGWKSQLDNTDAAKAAAKAKKLADMSEVNSESGGAPAAEPDKNDFDGAAKEAFAEEKK